MGAGVVNKIAFYDYITDPDYQLEAIDIESILTHGAEVGVKGKMTFANKQVCAFAYFSKFKGSGSSQILTIQSYLLFIR
jgi:hypothetical protein